MDRVTQRIDDFVRGSTWKRHSFACAAVLIAASSVGGCSTTIPLPSFIATDNEATGSIPRVVSPLSASLDEEDWRRAKGALAVALDPQGDGAAVNWDNPKSGAKGSVTPVGDAYAKEERVCRAFVADIGGEAPAKSVTGTGCRDKGGEWAVSDVKPWKKG
jgi:surface antigen